MKKILLISIFIVSIVQVEYVTANESEAEISRATKEYLVAKGRKVGNLKPNLFNSILTRFYLKRIEANVTNQSSSLQSFETMKYCNEEQVGGYWTDSETFVVTYQCEDGRYFDQVWDLTDGGAFKSPPLFH